MITLFTLMASGSASYALLLAVLLARVAGAIATAEQYLGEGRLRA